MIATLKGTISESHLLLVVIEAAGVGYEVHIPITTSEKLPGVGKEAHLYIYSVYREDSATLYGFLNRGDREFFKLLVEKVSGVGPKMAITLFSKMSVRLLQTAIMNADVKTLSQCPGIGKKTAERLIIELKDKLGKMGMTPSLPTQLITEPASGSVSADNKYQDALAALMTLGYKAAVADKAINKAIQKLGADADVEELIKTALNS